MKVFYDFHIHTALSPCALDEMTPNNIVNMARILGLNAIAITDHNSAKNIKPVLKVAREADILVIPGMEIESREEIHIVCLFPDEDKIDIMEELIYSNLTMLKNKPKILGNQLLFDEEDEIIGVEEKLLSFATKLSLEEIVTITYNLGGIAIPAHIDRPSYSIISNLGIIPQNQLLTALEISQYANYSDYAKKYPTFHLLQSSDSHELGFIGICKSYLDIHIDAGQKLTSEAVIQYLRKQR